MHFAFCFVGEHTSDFPRLFVHSCQPLSLYCLQNVSGERLLSASTWSFLQTAQHFLLDKDPTHTVFCTHSNNSHTHAHSQIQSLFLLNLIPSANNISFSLSLSTHTPQTHTTHTPETNHCNLTL